MCVRFQTASGGTEEAELSEKSTGRSVRAYLGLPEHAGVLRRAGTSAPLPDQLGDLDEVSGSAELLPLPPGPSFIFRAPSPPLFVFISRTHFPLVLFLCLDVYLSGFLYLCLYVPDCGCLRQVSPSAKATRITRERQE